MTEVEWMACPEPEPMLRFLRGKMSDRKVRLFAVAYARLLDAHIPDERRAAIAVGERLADGLATEEERLHFVNMLYGVVVDYGRATGRNWLVDTPVEQVSGHFAALAAVGCWKPHANLADSYPNWQMARQAARSSQPPLLRDIFGNPFRPVPFAAEWRTDAVRTLARRMYDGRDFSAMPTLAGALQDAGCENADILDHCRGEGPHVRGCWVLDLILGLE